MAKKSKSKRSRHPSPSESEQPVKDEEVKKAQDDEQMTDHPGIPFRDLKKNLGCG